MTYEAHNWNFKGDGAQSGHKLGGWSALAKVSRGECNDDNKAAEAEREREDERERERDDARLARHRLVSPLASCGSPALPSYTLPAPARLPTHLPLLVTLRPSISAALPPPPLPLLHPISLCGRSGLMSHASAKFKMLRSWEMRDAMRNVASLSAFVFCDNFHILHHKLNTWVLHLEWKTSTRNREEIEREIEVEMEIEIEM